MKREVSYCINPPLIVNILKVSTKFLLNYYKMAAHKFSDIYCKHLAAIVGMKGIDEYF